AVYHAAAVFASNYVVSLLGEAASLLEASGWSEQEAVRGLAPLAEGAIANVTKRGPTAALTGPVRRGGALTIRRHLAALGELDERRHGDLYRMLGHVAVENANAAGFDVLAAGQ